jgi:hypothetical protein
MSTADGKRNLQKIFKKFQGPLKLDLKHFNGSAAKPPGHALVTTISRRQCKC